MRDDYQNQHIQRDDQFHFSHEYNEEQCFLDQVHILPMIENIYQPPFNLNTDMLYMYNGSNQDEYDYQQECGELYNNDQDNQYAPQFNGNQIEMMEVVNLQNQMEQRTTQNNVQYIVEQAQITDDIQNQLIADSNNESSQIAYQNMCLDQSLTPQEIQIPAQKISKKITKNKQISQPKKYFQDQLYKGVFQRLCILCKDKPDNKSYKQHLVKIIVDTIDKPEQATNKTVIEITQTFDRFNEEKFVKHLQNMLLNCQKKVNIEHPSVLSAIKSVYNSVTIQLNNNNNKQF